MRDWHQARRGTGLIAGVAVAALLCPSAAARAACTAAQVIATEPACQTATGTCLISSLHSVENGCTLDFGARDVRLDGVLVLGSHSATLRANSFTMLVHGRIDGVGDAVGAQGGMIVIETVGNFTVFRTGTQAGQIDVSGNSRGGQILAHVGGSAQLDGKLQAEPLTGSAAGGLIAVTAAGDITAAAGSLISAPGGIDSEGGGEIDLIAGGNLTLQSDPDVSGLDGGFLELQAGGTVTMQGTNAAGEGDAGSGGCVDVTAGAGVALAGVIDATGASGTFMTGGCGGLVCLDSGLGDVSIASSAAIRADGASPDGGGGQVALIGRGSASISGAISARGPAGGTCGGDMCAEFGYDVSLFATGEIDVSGGDSGGEVDLLAARNMTVSGPVDASGRQAGSIGGDVSLRASERVRGLLTVGNVVDVRSNAPCTAESGCGVGGTTDLVACNLVINAAGALLAAGADAGENAITAREQLTVRGTIDAQPMVAGGANGVNRFVYSAGHPPSVLSNGIHPAAKALAVSICPDMGETDPPCLTPCPICGDGIEESPPETCDLGAMPPQSCGGCSIYCQVENCDDGLTCTGDTCNPTFGCVHQRTPGCEEPTATVTGTPPTATVTPTASPSPTASATVTASQSSTPASSPTASLTPPVAPSNTAAPTVTATSTTATTATADPTATVSAASTATATAVATAAASNTPLPDPTGTPPAGCTGDCDASHDVTVSELILGVNIALGNSGVAACPAFDPDGDGQVAISALVAAVNAALNGC